MFDILVIKCLHVDLFGFILFGKLHAPRPQCLFFLPSDLLTMNSTFLSSRLLILSAASFSLLLKPSSIFFFSVIVFLRSMIYFWYLLVFSFFLCTFSLYSSILPRDQWVSLCSLNYLSGKLPSFQWGFCCFFFSWIFVFSFVCNTFLCFLILLLSLCLFLWIRQAVTSPSLVGMTSYRKWIFFFSPALALHCLWSICNYLSRLILFLIVPEFLPRHISVPKRGI